MLVFNPECVENRMPVGNHYHPEESGRIEFFVAVGGEGDLFRFVWKDPGSTKVQSTVLKHSESCIIPIGASHAFVPLQNGCQLKGYSNTPHDPDNDITDEIILVQK
jgi:hypothetical protein